MYEVLAPPQGYVPISTPQAHGHAHVHAGHAPGLQHAEGRHDTPPHGRRAAQWEPPPAEAQGRLVLRQARAGRG